MIVVSIRLLRNYSKSVAATGDIAMVGSVIFLLPTPLWPTRNNCQNGSHEDKIISFTKEDGVPLVVNVVMVKKKS